MNLHNYALKHKALKAEQETELLKSWQGFFKDMCDLISQSESIKQVSFTFKTQLLGSEVLEFRDPIFSTAECNLEEIDSNMQNFSKLTKSDLELASYITKVCYTVLPDLVEDLSKLDCDDVIVVKSDSVEANFRKYEDWDLFRNQIPSMHLF